MCAISAYVFLCLTLESQKHSQQESDKELRHDWEQSSMSQNDISSSFDFVKYASTTTVGILLKQITAVSCAELNYPTPACTDAV